VRFHYILEGHEVRAVEDALEWARWFETADRRVAFTDLGYCTVSTVFLGIDHRFLGRERLPIVFETMVFANPNAGERFPEEMDNMMERYSTWDEAEAGHEAMVALVRTEFWKRA
jgi:hypothetical protein